MTPPEGNDLRGEGMGGGVTFTRTQIFSKAFKLFFRPIKKLSEGGGAGLKEPGTPPVDFP